MNHKCGIIYLSLMTMTNFAYLADMNTDNGQDGKLVWIDMEMTDLNIPPGQILEIAAIVTDSGLNTIAEGPEIVVHHPPEILATMSQWSKVQHSLSGLVNASSKSNLSVVDAEQKVLDFISKYVKSQESPMVGSTIYMDRMFIRHYMPKLEEYLHYRLIDVSTIRELIKRWVPSVYNELRKNRDDYGSHRAIADIRYSIKELQHYKKYICREEFWD